MVELECDRDPSRALSEDDCFRGLVRSVQHINMGLMSRMREGAKSGSDFRKRILILIKLFIVVFRVVVIVIVFVNSFTVRTHSRMEVEDPLVGNFKEDSKKSAAVPVPDPALVLCIPSDSEHSGVG